MSERSTVQIARLMFYRREIPTDITTLRISYASLVP
jgi:hypothetical protein